MSSKDKKENGNENDKILMSSNEDNENENEGDENENENEDSENENEDDENETMSQNEKYEIIKGKNDILDKIIDKSKSFEQLLKSLKKQEDLKWFWSLVIKS